MERNLWIDYLRTVITVLVVAHHAAMAYTTFAFFDTEVYIRSTSPVVDANRWIGLDVFMAFNDTFFMALMFFISGLFVFPALQKKGASAFTKERLLRLGLPFMVAVTFIIPFAYTPSYYISHNQFNFFDFVSDYLFVQQWPVGPPWFIWVLLVFNCIAALIPMHIYSAIGEKITRAAKLKPIQFFVVLFFIVLLSYAPVSIVLGHYAWTGFGPFDFQVNRFLFYFTFFMVGVVLGCTKWGNYFFKGKMLLGLPWSGWALKSLCAFVLFMLYTYCGIGVKWHGIIQSMVFSLLFVLCSICISFACLALFRAYLKKSNPAMDSLCKNAYGIYLLHYIPVSWLQFALLDTTLPVVLKFLIIFIVSLCSSWAMVYFLKKIKIVNRFV
ncbi:acyltransferase family protein [Flavobacterium sp. RHBU_24]|uniref:acyltransferase family protein n=1 Tax=Flavobacterium sp. RHBU_24 TaxID=3391185 RepID=UPI003984F0B0